MKKIFALMLALLMMCACAFAEEEAEYVEVNTYVFDPLTIEGIEGEFMLLEQFGIQFFVPANFVFHELSEEDIAKGAIVAMGAEDGSIGMSISYAGVADAEGNIIVDPFELAAFYEANGATEVEVAMFNDMLGMCYVLHTPIDYDGRAYLTEEGAVLGFNVLGNGTEEMRLLGNIILGTIMPAPVVEEVAE